MKRIQRKRRKGWRMPPDTIYVGRPTPWGNPFRVIGDMVYYYCTRRTILSPWILWYDDGGHTPEEAIWLYEKWITGKIPVEKYGLPPVPDLEPLRGKNLMCWCPLSKPCHVDVLLKLLKDGEQQQFEFRNQS